MSNQLSLFAAPAVVEDPQIAIANLTIAPWKERPILMSGAMVWAERDGRKTKTRRAVKIKDGRLHHHHSYIRISDRGAEWNPVGGHPSEPFPDDRIGEFCPYGNIGDRLWVRETWLKFQELYFYRATDLGELPDSLLQFSDPPKWKPSIFMPRSVSRTTLEIIGIKLERLQDISEEDAIAEGVDEFSTGKAGLNFEINGRCTRNPIQAFEFLWDSINGKTMPWALNPWVWAIEFLSVHS